jgi:hypothetical protein
MIMVDKSHNVKENSPFKDNGVKWVRTISKSGQFRFGLIAPMSLMQLFDHLTSAHNRL